MYVYDCLLARNGGGASLFRGRLVTLNRDPQTFQAPISQSLTKYTHVSVLEKKANLVSKF